MKVTSNKDMLNAIRNQASSEYKERMPEITSADENIMVAKSWDKLSEYPSLKNEFIGTLINKVVRTDFFSKVYENPLKMLKKGSLTYGASIEELFVHAADAKGFFSQGTTYKENYDISDSEARDGLLNKQKPEIKALYITKNFAHYFKTSISDVQLRGAFTSANGLSELVNQIVGSLTSGAEQEEFKMMKNLLNAVSKAGRLKGDNGLLNQDEAIPTSNAGDKASTMGPNVEGVTRVMRLEAIDEKVDIKDPSSVSFKEKGKSLARKIRSLSGRMKFVSNKYNMAGVNTWCNPEDLVFVTTPEIVAELDVDVLADAFNVSKAELNVRVILVDELPSQFCRGKKTSQSSEEKDRIGYYNTTVSAAYNGKTTYWTDPNNAVCLGILMDKQFIQAIDTVNEARQFENGRSLTTNLFLHRQGLLANCYFANAVAIMGVKTDSATDIDPK